MMPQPIKQDEERAALVTASSSGIGLAVARALRKGGYCIVLNGRDPAKLDRAVKELEAQDAGANSKLWVEGVVADLTQMDACSAIWSCLRERAVPLRAAFINTPTPAIGLPEVLSEEDWRSAVQGVIRFPDEAIRRAGEDMARTGGGVIVVNSSCSATVPIEREFYLANTLRAASVAQGKAYARQFVARGVRVNIMLTGYVETPLTRSLVERFAEAQLLKTDELWASWGRAIPIGRLARPEEIACVAMFLMSEASSYIVGAAVEVDGGLSMAHSNF